MDEAKRISSTTRFAQGNDDEDITIDYFEKRFEVRGKGIAGPIILATDAKLAPEIPEGSRLLVNANNTVVEHSGCFVLRKPDQSYDIALIERGSDGTYRYTSDKDHPEILSDLSSLDFVGRVWEAQALTPIRELGTVGDGWTRQKFEEEPEKIVMMWFPLWTDKFPYPNSAGTPS